MVIMAMKTPARLIWRAFDPREALFLDEEFDHLSLRHLPTIIRTRRDRFSFRL
jgi:hypothetical protein